MINNRSKKRNNKNREDKVHTGTWRPIWAMLSIRSLTFPWSLDRVRTRGLLILSRGSSRITAPPCLRHTWRSPCNHIYCFLLELIELIIKLHIHTDTCKENRRKITIRGSRNREGPKIVWKLEKKSHFLIWFSTFFNHYIANEWSVLDFGVIIYP